MSCPRLLGVALALLSLVMTLSVARDARCDPPGPRAYPVYVLSVDTEDADDQGEALTGALRSRVRGAQGFSLSETTVTLSMLTAALKCPRVPDAACLVKIGDQLKADRFIWGTMQKAPGNMVKVDLRLWARGKPEVVASDAYTDNLKDQNDERLQRVAQRLFDRLSGASSGGSLVIHAGDAGGLVMVDGQRRGTLDKGEATVEVPSGVHAVEVRVPGYTWAKESVTITAGKEARLNVTLVPEGGAAGGLATSTGPSGRKIAGWVAVGIGAALLVTSGIEAISWANKKSSAENGFDPNLYGGKPCFPLFRNPASPDPKAVAAAADLCKKDDDLKQTSTLAYVFGAAGAVATGVGIYLLITDGGGSEKPAPKFEDRAARNAGPTVRLVPSVTPTVQGLLLQGSF